MRNEELQQQIQRLRIEHLAALGEALLDFRSPQDFQAWLATNPPDENAT
jgi:hypothetical protein